VAFDEALECLGLFDFRGTGRGRGDDPSRDQHAAHEHNRRGQPVCARLGAAVDFIVDDENMGEVARWIVANTPFDRLYCYGDDLPLHLSYGPAQARQVVMMMAGPSGRLIPRVMALERFLGMPVPTLTPTPSPGETATP
jgi:hypothetical protein